MGLAPVLVEQIFDIIKDINAQGTTTLLVEQNALMALGIAHRGYVLQTGQIVLPDSPRRSARMRPCRRPTWVWSSAGARRFVPITPCRRQAHVGGSSASGKLCAQLFAAGAAAYIRQ